MRKTIATIPNERQISLVVVYVPFHGCLGFRANPQVAAETSGQPLNLSVIPVAAEVGIGRPHHRQVIKHVTAEIYRALPPAVQV